MKPAVAVRAETRAAERWFKRPTKAPYGTSPTQRVVRWCLIALGLGIIAFTGAVNAVTDRVDRRPR